ncbi:VOC family protein [Francisella sp. Scap27]|uniref:VOC family protein n=1 Tax=Francisella sp. Scap27 TaxID=2589986 RepID=UPI0015B9BB97|nr:VOC family protein [Francisella sp. Scap27]QLE79377.1 VOC family protein [Francisella sp. Scap27]
MSKKNHLGIDHPLVAVRSIDKAVEDFTRLGFFINPRHHHPWGTDNHLLMFPENFIEVISIYDDTKLDLPNEKGFTFGRFISDSISRREGISLVALHSTDAREDHKSLENNKVENLGIVDFRRTAHLPNGTTEVCVSLVMLINNKFPSISHFLCHQHNPETIWMKEWMEHPNGANGITSVSYAAHNPDDLYSHFCGIYGADKITKNKLGYMTVQTDRGVFEILSKPQANERFAGVDIPLTDDQLPSGIAISVSTKSISKAKSHLDNNKVEYVQTTDNCLLIPAHYAGNTIIEIHQDTI